MAVVDSNQTGAAGRVDPIAWALEPKCIRHAPALIGQPIACPYPASVAEMFFYNTQRRSPFHA